LRSRSFKPHCSEPWLGGQKRAAFRIWPKRCAELAWCATLGFCLHAKAYLTKDGPVVTQGAPLLSGTVDVPRFDRDALIKALRTDQAGNSTFPEFLTGTWRAGIVRYDVDFLARTCTYYGAEGEEYIEEYPEVPVR